MRLQNPNNSSAINILPNQARICRTLTLPAAVICAGLIHLATPASAESNTAARNKPLFPIALTHEFPDAEATFDEVRGLIMKQYYADGATRYN